MGMDVFDLDSDALPDFCRDVLGLEPAASGSPPETALTGNLVLILVYGLLLGLVIGFALGALAQPAFLAGS